MEHSKKYCPFFVTHCSPQHKQIPTQMHPQQKSSTLPSKTAPSTTLIFDLPHGFLSQVITDIVAIRRGTYQHEVSLKPSSSSSSSSSTSLSFASSATPKVKSNYTCRSCDIGFTSLEDQRAHFKTDWHRHNLKLKMQGQKPISSKEYQEREGYRRGGAGRKVQKKNGNSVEEEEVGGEEEEKEEEKEEKEEEEEEERDSGSEEEEEEEIWNPEDDTLTSLEDSGDSSLSVAKFGSPRITFERKNGDTLHVWKAVLQRDPNDEDFLGGLQVLSMGERRKWTIMLCSGGHFAGGVFEGSKCLKHKTFHRYTTRRKQGGLQSVKDNKSGGSISSAGAQIRRHNETRLHEEISDLLRSWRTDLEQSSLIFLYAPYHTRSCFFPTSGGGNGGSELRPGDPRLRRVPFPTHRPTFSEVTRIWQTLASLEIIPLVQ